MSDPDFSVIGHGTVCQIIAKTAAAKEFAAANFPVEGWQGSPDNFKTDWRAARDLHERLTAEGWNVECEDGQ